jgi:hypothetical protein
MEYRIVFIVLFSCFLFFFSKGHPWNIFVSLQFLNLGQSVGLLGKVISLSQDRYLTQTELNVHKHPCLSKIRTYDPGVRASEDSSCLRPLGYRDRRMNKESPYIRAYKVNEKEVSRHPRNIVIFISDCTTSYRRRCIHHRENLRSHFLTCFFIKVVSMYTTCINIWKKLYLVYRVFMLLTINKSVSLNCTNWFVFILEVRCFFCEIRTELLNRSWIFD